MQIYKKTKIIATIGPASENKDVLARLIDAGMNVARLNFSHGDYPTHQKKINTINEFISQGANIAILLDTKGPEIRTGDFENDSAEFFTGDIVRIAMTPILGTKERFSVSYPHLYDDVSVGGTIRADDGRLNFQIDMKDEKNRELVCHVLNNRVISSKKNVCAPFTKLSMPFISEKDYNDIKFGCENNVDFIAASFTRCAQDILDIRKILHECGKEDIQIIAKIENQEGVDNLNEIIQIADGIMVARGDLGVEVPAEDVPVIQMQIIHECLRFNKICIVATHMLDSMVHNPFPTRAEVSDVANAVLEGCDSVMLSGETANGDFPIESVQMEARISHRMEDILDYHKLAENAYNSSLKTKNDAIAFSVANTVIMTGAKLIVAFSKSGTTSKRISNFRPQCPIISVSGDLKLIRKLTLFWGVYGYYNPIHHKTYEEFEVTAQRVAKEYGVKPGEIIVITGGDGFGSTNFMKIVTIK